eukprot:gene14980-20153_t
MVFLLTDTGEYRELQCPGTVTIGRGLDNDIRPDSKSISKYHAILTINAIANTNKTEVLLEDSNSSNGTFVGSSPLEIEKVMSKIKLFDGDYIKFGFSQKYFRYVERIPVETENNHIPQLVGKGTTSSSSNMANIRSNSASNNTSNNFNNNSYNLNNLITPLSPVVEEDVIEEINIIKRDGSSKFDSNVRNEYKFTKSNSSSNTNKSPSLILNNIENNEEDYEIFDKPHKDVILNKSKSNQFINNRNSDYEADEKFNSSSKNISISINYPTGNNSSLNPVSVTIDPSIGNNKSREYKSSNRHHSLISNSNDINRSSDNDFINNNDSENVSEKIIMRSNHNDDNLTTYPVQKGSSLRFMNDNKDDTGYYNTMKTSSATKVPLNSFVKDQPLQMSPINQRYPLFNESLKSNKSVALDYGSPKRDVNNLNSNKFDFIDTNQIKMNLKDYSNTSKKYSTIDIDQAKMIPVRRSWPQDAKPPSSDMIASFVDVILGVDVGATELYYNNIKIENQKYNTKNKNKININDDAKEEQDNSSTNMLLNRIPQFQCIAPKPFHDSVISEAIADMINNNGILYINNIYNKSIIELNELLRQTLLGSHIEINQNSIKNSTEFEYALQSLLTNIINKVIDLCKQGLENKLIICFNKLEKSKKYTNNIYKLLFDTINSLDMLNGFILGTFLPEESKVLSENMKYEIISLVISGVLDRLDRCNILFYQIVNYINEVTDEYDPKHAKVVMKGKTSLSVELEQLRKMKSESELLPFIDRIRQQEASILEKKMF